MKKHYFDDEWKAWIWSNIKNGVTKLRVYEDLLSNDFDMFAIINELRYIPAVLRKKDEVLPHKVAEKIESSSAIRIDAPIYLYQFENFLSAQECQEVITLQRQYSARSTTGDMDDCKIDKDRTSFTSYFEMSKDAEVQRIIGALKQKIQLLTGIPKEYSEAIQGQWYKAGGFYREHFDAADTYGKLKHSHGNRTWSCMITLNNVEAGGYTAFPKLRKEFEPQAGQALIWYNLSDDGLAHPLSLHAGKPVVKGEKFIITQWFHQCVNL